MYLCLLITNHEINFETIFKVFLKLRSWFIYEIWDKQSHPLKVKWSIYVLQYSLSKLRNTFSRERKKLVSNFFISQITNPKGDGGHEAATRPEESTADLHRGRETNPGVNFINILQAAFVLIFFRQKKFKDKL